MDSKLEEMIKIHRMCSERVCVSNPSSKEWLECMHSLEVGVAELAAMRAVIQRESSSLSVSVSSEEQRLEALERESEIRNEAQRQLQRDADSLSLELVSMDEEIQRLAMQREQIQQRLSTTKQAMDSNKVSMSNYDHLKSAYMATMNERVERIQNGQSLLPVIESINGRFEGTMDAMVRTEREWTHWNQMHVARWISICIPFQSAVHKQALIQHLKEQKVRGNHLVKLTESDLKRFGVEYQCERIAIINNIRRLTSSSCSPIFG